MSVLLKQVIITDPTSPHHGQKMDVCIDHGIYKHIGHSLPKEGVEKVYDLDGHHISPGWVDLAAFFGDPGWEHREDLHTGALAAQKGGFTDVCCLPETIPALDQRAAIEYVNKKGRETYVSIWPMGALSKGLKGKELTEMYDMHNAGVRLFTDGLMHPVSTGLLFRALQYMKDLKATLVLFPYESDVCPEGSIHEGLTSVALGLKGIPDFTEVLAVEKAITLLRETQSQVHLGCISAGRSVELLRRAKAEGLSISASVSPYHLLWTASDPIPFDSSYKIFPPLREEADRQALIAALKEGIIDTVVSLHIPHDDESKQLEFEYAAFGILSLQTVFPLLRKVFPDPLDLGWLVDRLSHRGRRLLGLEQITIEEGAKAHATVFHPESSWVWNMEENQSKSKNHPLWGTTLEGRVTGIIHQGKVQWNHPIQTL